MRAVIQRVASASVSVDGKLISEIGHGVCVLVGISRDDTEVDSKYIVRKILNLRIFDDENGKRWSKSVKDKGFEILCVSQFTLYTVLKGNKPDFHSAMEPTKSKEFYSQFLQELKKGYSQDKIKDGEFGAYMEVDIKNDGPVTVTLESPQRTSQSNKMKQKTTAENEITSEAQNKLE